MKIKRIKKDYHTRENIPPQIKKDFDDASLYAGKKGICLNLTAFETQNQQYGDTHYLKANLTYEQYQALSEEERKNRHIVGNMGERLQAIEQISPATDNTNVNTSSEDDLPF